MDRLHYLNIRPDGRLQRAGAHPTLPRDVDSQLAVLKQRKKLVLYFHGGLVNEASGIAGAEALLPVLDDGQDRHAIFVIWETGFVETIRAHAIQILSSVFFKKLRDLVLGNVLKQLGGGGKGAGGEAISPEKAAKVITDDVTAKKLETQARGAAAIMSEQDLEQQRATIEANIEEDLQADPSIAQSLEDPDEANKLLRPEVKAQMAQAEAKGLIGSLKLITAAAGVVVNVIRRYLRKRDHGLHATVVEEILRQIYVADLGEAIWGEMKTSAKSMWSSNAGVPNESLFGARLLLDGIVKLQQSTGLKVDLIGHSAGAIAILELLNAAEAAGLHFKPNHIVFLAPACTTENLVNGLARKAQSFETFRMFTMKDDLEAKDTLVTAVPALYPSSLLYFISGVLEKESDFPIAGMRRFGTGKDPYTGGVFAESEQFFSEAGRDRMVQAITDGAATDGLRCDSIHHGGFVDPQVMRDSLSFIVKN